MPTPNDTTAPRPLLKPKQVAERLNCTTKVLEKWRALEVGPRWTRMGPSMVRYFGDDLDHYITSRVGLPDERPHPGK